MGVHGLDSKLFDPSGYLWYQSSGGAWFLCLNLSGCHVVLYIDMIVQMHFSLPLLHMQVALEGVYQHYIHD